MKKWTLQVRVTVIVGVILLAACALLTINSLLAARTYYGDYAQLLASGAAEVDPALSAEIGPLRLAVNDFYQRASQRFSGQSLGAMVLIVALALAATYWAAGWMLRPLKELTQAARTMDGRHLDRRVPLQNARGEVLVLAEAFNYMLARLEEAFIVQKSFAANAAHELKTPLTVIKSSLQVLEMAPDPQPADYREFMQDTGQSLDRLVKTVEGLSALAGLDNAPMDEAVDVYALARQAQGELSAQAAAASVSLSVSGAPAAKVRGSSALLYRLLYNLMENAVKYNRPGGSVDVQVGQGESTVRVRVADTGIGIEEGALPHIFEPFYRADPSRSQKVPGSGLGLALVQLIAERHGGKVSAESEAGEGSLFTVVLNRGPAEEESKGKEKEG